jgi:hydrogenase expression/formation protein HypC
MCLAVPLKLIQVDGEHGVVELGGIRRKVNLAFVEGAQPGDYVVVHTGFAITRMDEAEAAETLRLLNECIEKSEG